MKYLPKITNMSISFDENFIDANYSITNNGNSFDVLLVIKEQLDNMHGQLIINITTFGDRKFQPIVNQVSDMCYFMKHRSSNPLLHVFYRELIAKCKNMFQRCPIKKVF